MAQATGNPAWLVVNDEEQDVAVGDLMVEDIRHGPATVASITLALDNAEAGTELTLGDILDIRKTLTRIARQALLDGYEAGRVANPGLRESELPERRDTFDSFHVSLVGERDGECEQISGRHAPDPESFDRVFYTLYGDRDEETWSKSDENPSEAILDSLDEAECIEWGVILANGRPLYRVTDETWARINNDPLYLG